MTTASDQFLGCLMLDPSVLVATQVPLEAVDPELRPLYRAICNRIIDSQPVDFLNITLAYKNEKWWPGAVRVSEMENSAVSKYLAKNYAAILKKAHKQRQLEAWYMAARKEVESGDPQQAIVELETGLSRLVDQDYKPPFETFEKIGRDYLASDKHDNCIKTGNDLLDRKWYLDNGGLHIIAARTGMGKTTFACWLATQLLNSGKAVLFFSIEMCREQIANKFLHVWSLGDPNQYDAVFEMRKNEKLLISDKPANTIEEIMLTSSIVGRSQDLGAIFVDYLQIVQTGERFRSTNDKVAHVSIRLKELARRNKCPVIALAQINRSAESGHDKRPELSQLRDSGSIEQDADSVVMLYRDEYYKRENTPEDEKGLTEIIIAKQRQRDRATLECVWNRQTGEWNNWQIAKKKIKPQNFAREFAATKDWRTQ